MNIRKIVIIQLIIGVLFSSGAFAAKEKSHEEYYNDAVQSFVTKKGASGIKDAINKLEKAIESYSGDKNDKQLGIYYRTLGTFHRLNSDAENGAPAMEKAVTILEKYWKANGALLSTTYYRLAEMQINLEKFPEAENNFLSAARGFGKVASSKGGESVDSAYYYLVRIVFSWHNLKGKGSFKKELKLEDSETNKILSDIHVGIARSLYNEDAGKYLEDIISLIESANSLDGGDVESYNLLGIAYDISGKYEEALAAYEKALSYEKDNYTVFYNLACSYSLQKNKEKALEYIQKAVDAGFRDYDTMKYDQDLALIKNEKVFKDLLASIEPKGTPKHYEDFTKVLRDWERGRSEKAMGQLQKLIDHCTDNKEDQCPDYIGLYYSNMGSFMFNTKNTDMAIELWTIANELLKAEKYPPRYLLASNYANIASAEFSLDNIDVAIENYESSLEYVISYIVDYKLSNENEEAAEKLVYYVLIEMGNLYDEIGEESDHVLSKHEYNEAYSNYERNVGAYYIGQKDLVLAAYHAKRATQINEHSFMALNLLGIVYDYQKEYQKAYDAFSSGLRLAPEDASLLYNMACNMAWQGKKKEAYEYLSLAAEAGFAGDKTMADDEAFSALKKDVEFKTILNRVKMNAAIVERDKN